jgi:hypothetical protein
MVYKFDPKWFNGAIFEFADPLTMARGWMEFGSRLEPVPASYFPKQLVIERAKAPLPDLFHTSRGIFVVSGRAISRRRPQAGSTRLSMPTIR